MYFACFQDLSIKVPCNCENYMKPVEACGNYISKCPDVSGNMAPLLVHTVLLKKIIQKCSCIIHCEAPCMPFYMSLNRGSAGIKLSSISKTEFDKKGGGVNSFKI